MLLTNSPIWTTADCQRSTANQHWHQRAALSRTVIVIRSDGKHGILHRSCCWDSLHRHVFLQLPVPPAGLSPPFRSEGSRTIRRRTSGPTATPGQVSHLPGTGPPVGDGPGVMPDAVSPPVFCGAVF
eukprot:767143-Hanusia_phi.AAC.7